MSEWVKLPLYLFSFIRFNSTRGGMKKYIQGSSLNIPFSDFRDFVYGKVWQDYGVSMFESEEKLNQQLDLCSRMNMIDYENGQIVLNGENLVILARVVRSQIRQLKSSNVPEYDKEVTRRIYVSSMNEQNERDESIIQSWKKRKFDELHSSLVNDQDTYEKLIEIFSERK